MAPQTTSTTRESEAKGLGALHLGHVLGVPLEVHWTFAFLVALVVAAGWPRGPGAVASGLAWIVALFACVVAHELAHCVVAQRRGGVVRRIVLLPIGGVSQLEAIPTDPDDELAVAAAGPATSLVLGVALLCVAVLSGAAVWPPALVTGSWLVRLAWLNVLLGAFNLVPALPMDGGRILRAGLARRRPRSAATITAAHVARALGLTMVAVGVLWDLWLVFIGVFVLLGAAAEERAAIEERDAGGPARPEVKVPPPCARRPEEEVRR